MGINRLTELNSQGQTFYGVSWQAPSNLSSGSTGQKVSQLQYMLNVVSEFVPSVPSVTQDGIFGPATQRSVLAYQRFAGLTVDGIVGPATWDSLYNRVSGILSENELRKLQTPSGVLQLGDTDF